MRGQRAARLEQGVGGNRHDGDRWRSRRYSTFPLIESSRGWPFRNRRQDDQRPARRAPNFPTPPRVTMRFRADSEGFSYRLGIWCSTPLDDDAVTTK